MIALDLNNLQMSLTDRRKVGKNLGAVSKQDKLDEQMKKIYRIKIDNIMKDEKNYLFYTYWVIVRKEDDMLLGDIGFKGIPGGNGEIEVGYGIDDEYRGKGYMTEALKAMIGWAFEQSIIPVVSVIASTDKDNIASQKVLIKNGMSIYGEDEKYLWWKVSRREDYG